MNKIKTLEEEINDLEVLYKERLNIKKSELKLLKIKENKTKKRADNHKKILLGVFWLKHMEENRSLLSYFLKNTAYFSAKDLESIDIEYWKKRLEELEKAEKNKG